MGLLAPLYALAALAIVGPIIFHLIKRQPQGQMPFGSLMFLSPSPPKLTRRSRLDNILLLLLRAAALGAIAFAFARPYFRQTSFLNSSLSSRNIVLLLDTSASMQRPDVWEQALETLRELSGAMSPEDRLALYTVDATLKPIVPLDFETPVNPESTIQSVQAALPALKPSWQKSDLAQGLQSLADMFNAAAIAGKVEAGTENQIVLVSDLHEGSGLDALQGFPWPASVQLDVRQILPQALGNARASLMLPDADDGDDAQQEAEQAIRIRIENNPDAPQQAFELGWVDAANARQASVTTVQVPAGQTRVVPLGPRPAGATHIELFGDTWPADNRVYVPTAKAVRQVIGFVGPSDVADDANLSFFLRKAPLDTPLVRREIISLDPQAIDFGDSALKAIILEPIAGTESLAPELRSFAQAGGTVVVCLARPIVNPSAEWDRATVLLKTLCAIQEFQLGEADVKQYDLLAKVDYTHPVFAPFADPRFNDFSKLRFWQHRILEFPADQPAMRVLASLDDQSPLLIEQVAGNGRIWIMSTGWQPQASTLALSSKFVPILMGILDPRRRLRSQTVSVDVGQPIDVSDLVEADPELPPLSEVLASRAEDGWSDSIPVDTRTAGGDGASIKLLEPGLYTLQAGVMERQVAVQVPRTESQHAALDREVFSQLGIRLGVVASDVQRRDSQRQLQIEELEGKQKLWQWLIALGIVILVIETWLAGFLARRA